MDVRRGQTDKATSGRFRDPDTTVDGSTRAVVKLEGLKTLWFNTGTLCNIECANCYIHSSPTNDALSYITLSEFTPFLDEIQTDKWPVDEIAFTGGEPFMNPDMIAMAAASLQAGFQTLILTNAMQPMQRSKIKASLLELQGTYGDQLTLRISLDHYSLDKHDEERGKGSFARAITGLDWLREHGFSFSIAGRSLYEEDTNRAFSGYQALFDKQSWGLNAQDPRHLMMFPEMDEGAQSPEITTDCWGILNQSPADLMCASSRMVVKRKGASKPTIVPCTLITEDPAFDMGATLQDAAKTDGGMFDDGAVKLCHIHCSKFCVLGGGSCS